MNNSCRIQAVGNQGDNRSDNASRPIAGILCILYILSKLPEFQASVESGRTSDRMNRSFRV
jgi:hypothetical protein